MSKMKGRCLLHLSDHLQGSL